MPATDGPFELVLVVQEIFGVHEHIKDICRRLPKAGYFAAAAELFARQGEVSKISDIKDPIAIVAQVPDVQVMSDLRKPHCVAVCGVHSQIACRGRLVRAARSQYQALQPRHPLNMRRTSRRRWLRLYAGGDKGIPASDIE